MDKFLWLCFIVPVMAAGMVLHLKMKGQVKAAGYDIITPVLVCNTDDFASVEGLYGKDVVPGDDVIAIEK